MKIEEIDFQKLGLTNKRDTFTFSRFYESIFEIKPVSPEMIRKGIKYMKEQYIDQVNSKGWVPLNVEIKLIKKEKDRMIYAIGAWCAYFGKRNAFKIRELEYERTLLSQIVFWRK